MFGGRGFLAYTRIQMLSLALCFRTGGGGRTYFSHLSLSRHKAPLSCDVEMAPVY